LDIWKHCLSKLSEELSDQEFNTWIRPLQCQQVDGELQLFAPNNFVFDLVQQKYLAPIQRFVGQICVNGKPNIRLQVGSVQRHSPAVAIPASGQAVQEPAPANNVNSSFTFETFVQGKSNQLARAAS
jgi:chromosomal replication initiator protein